MIEAKGYTDQGGREYNEDIGFFAQKGGRGYAMIADGLGGHGNGDRAAGLAAETIKECITAWPESKRLTGNDIEDWFSRANERIVNKQTADCHMKTTLAFLCVDEREEIASLGHVGDSRIYHFEDGKVVFCTFDHSVSRMAVLAGEIGWEDIRFHTDRNKLLKALGKADEVKAETAEIVLDRQRSHAFLLCTDGFWEYVTEQEMEKTLKAAPSPEEWIKQMRRYLREKVDGSNDNNSAIAVWVTGQNLS